MQIKKIAGYIFIVVISLVTAAFAQDTKVLFEGKCSKCHSIDRPLSANKDRDGWSETVKRMQEKSPGWINDREAGDIINYLTEIRGKKNGQ